MSDQELEGRSAGITIEARWHVAIVILGVAALLDVLPERVRLLPSWLLWLVAVAVLTPLALVSWGPAKARWLEVEQLATLAFVGLGGLGNLFFLAILLRDIVGRSAPMSGLALLSSSLALWCVNVLIFSLLYWQMDRGGPPARSKSAARLPDWSFPQETAADDQVRPGWQPTYPDYLFLSFSTATAFSTTEVLPFTVRAKMLMMAEASVSLMTLALVAARAVNILGS
jgi:hypothetical protein